MKVGELELETTWVGPARRDGPELVFLHEGLGSITQWRDTPAAIAEATGLPALVYARQGYGRSTPVTVPRPLTYMHDEARLLPAVLAAAGVTDPILVGHSDGASIAIIAAGERRVAPRALVLIAPHVFVEDLSLAGIAQAKAQYETGGANSELRARLARYHDDVDSAFYGWNDIWLSQAFRSWRIDDALPKPSQRPVASPQRAVRST